MTWLMRRISQIAEKNGCDRQVVEISDQGEVRGQGYRDCDQNAEVDFYIIDGGGHSWPGGDPLPEWIVGHTNDDINATLTMWNFFKAHPKDD
jgi:polyhydroxybutyrate depolymerase